MWSSVVITVVLLNLFNCSTGKVLPSKDLDLAAAFARGAAQHHDAKADDGVVFSRCIQNGTIAMTFDDGPNAANGETAAVLDTLKAAGVQATFFLNGATYASLDDEVVRAVVRRTVAEGHYIGSHTWTHPDLATLDNAGILYQMNELYNKLNEILGQRPTTMRPPFGSYTQNVLNIVNGFLNYKVIMWSISTEDWAHPGDTAAGLQYYRNALGGTNPAMTPGHIVLHHDPLYGAPELAAAAIEYARSVGYRFVELRECLGLS